MAVGRTGIFHHVGTFLLLVATALLLVTTITAPVVNDMSLMRVRNSRNSQSVGDGISFGTFGYCLLNVERASNDDDDRCTSSRIGYSPLKQLPTATRITYTNAEESTTRALTHVMVLHPIAVGLTFISFLLAIGSGFIGAIFAASLSTLSFIVSVIVLATDFTLFSIVRRRVRDSGAAGAEVTWGTGIWTLTAAVVVLFLATVVVLATCCSSRLHQRRQARGEEKYAARTTTTRRRFWQRRSRY